MKREICCNSTGEPRTSLPDPNNSRRTAPTREHLSAVVKLTNQIRKMLSESGDPIAAADFDVDQWLTHWMEQPMPALGGRCPAEYMTSIEGQERVSRLLAMMQTGAYA